jgi:hypothetical protein
MNTKSQAVSSTDIYIYIYNKKKTILKRNKIVIDMEFLHPLPLEWLARADQKVWSII